MANIKASKKSIRKIAKLTLKNRAEKSRLRTLSKKLHAVVSAEDKLSSKTVAIDYMSALDKAVKHHVLHANRANRLKARLTKYIFVDLTNTEISSKVEIISESQEARSEIETKAEVVSENKN